MYQLLDQFLKDLPERQPLAFKAIYPKRIVPPHGYLNPKYFAVTLWSELRVGFEPEMKMLPHITGLVNCLMQMQYRVPTYFVRSEFAQAVAQTEPPEDFKFNEIKWPLPAMLFVLPTEFVLKYFGYMCPFLSIVRSDKGVYPDSLKNLPPCEMPIKAVNPVDNQVDRFNVVYPVYSSKEVPVDYTGSYPLSMNVNQMDAAPFEDATYLEEEKLATAFERYEIKKPVSDLPEGDQERLFNAKVQAFAVKLMLALTARPQVIKLGALQRPAKIKKNRVRDELWHPNLIGWDYRAQRVGGTGEHGTHASPRMHWRRGHMRNQPYGPKPWTDASPRRLAWIEPILVNAPEESEAPNA